MGKKEKGKGKPRGERVEVEGNKKRGGRESGKSKEKRQKLGGGIVIRCQLRNFPPSPGTFTEREYYSCCFLRGLI